MTRKQWTGKSRQTDQWPELALQVLGNEVWVASLPGEFLRLRLILLSSPISHVVASQEISMSVSGALRHIGGLLASDRTDLSLKQVSGDF